MEGVSGGERHNQDTLPLRESLQSSLEEDLHPLSLQDTLRSDGSVDEGKTQSERVGWGRFPGRATWQRS